MSRRRSPTRRPENAPFMYDFKWVYTTCVTCGTISDLRQVSRSCKDGKCSVCGCEDGTFTMPVLTFHRSLYYMRFDRMERYGTPMIEEGEDFSAGWIARNFRTQSQMEKLAILWGSDNISDLYKHE